MQLEVGEHLGVLRIRFKDWGFNNSGIIFAKKHLRKLQSSGVSIIIYHIFNRIIKTGDIRSRLIIMMQDIRVDKIIIPLNARTKHHNIKL